MSQWQFDGTSAGSKSQSASPTYPTSSLPAFDSLSSINNNDSSSLVNTLNSNNDSNLQQQQQSQRGASSSDELFKHIVQSQSSQSQKAAADASFEAICSGAKRADDTAAGLLFLNQHTTNLPQHQHQLQINTANLNNLPQQTYSGSGPLRRTSPSESPALVNQFAIRQLQPPISSPSSAAAALNWAQLANPYSFIAASLVNDDNNSAGREFPSSSSHTPNQQSFCSAPISSHYVNDCTNTLFPNTASVAGGTSSTSSNTVTATNASGNNLFSINFTNRNTNSDRNNNDINSRDFFVNSQSPVSFIESLNFDRMPSSLLSNSRSYSSVLNSPQQNQALLGDSYQSAAENFYNSLTGVTKPASLLTNDNKQFVSSHLAASAFNQSHNAQYQCKQTPNQQKHIDHANIVNGVHHHQQQQQRFLFGVAASMDSSSGSVSTFQHRPSSSLYCHTNNGQQQQRRRTGKFSSMFANQITTNFGTNSNDSSGNDGSALDREERYSRKVFAGGLPPDIDEDEIKASFSTFGSLVVDWPHKAESKSYFPPKGYAFLLFHDEASVQALIDACFVDKDKLYLSVSSPTSKHKLVQIRPWKLSDANCVIDSSPILDPRTTVFVGGVPRPLKASELAEFMNRMYGGVCYAGIDTDPDLKYPKGAGRVAFSNRESYLRAIAQRFVKFEHADFEKRVEIKPFVLDDQICDECHGLHSANKFAPFFCANIACLRYYCDFCWQQVHSNEDRRFHKPLVKESVDRPRQAFSKFN